MQLRMQRHTQKRMPRQKFLLGTYCLQESCFDEPHIAQMRQAGIDFLCGVPYRKSLLDLCARQHIGVMVQHGPGWFGGTGENAGQLCVQNPLAAYKKAAEAYVDHPAVWGIDIGDEPSCLDFPHYGKVFSAVQKLYPACLPYLNLYPQYGMLAQNTPQQTAAQLGTDTYADYIARYVRNVGSEYICYDYYLYSAGLSGALRNLQTVSDACRQQNRDLWIVLQVNSQFAEKHLTENDLRLQACTALSYGARVITWACWMKGWWYDNVLDDDGKPTAQYARLCAVNPELKAMGEALRPLNYRQTVFAHSGEEIHCAGTAVRVRGDCCIGVFGENGQTWMLAPVTQEETAETVVTVAAEKPLRLLCGTNEQTVFPVDGMVKLSLHGAQGAVLFL